jgi:hypothetical protein
VSRRQNPIHVPLARAASSSSTSSDGTALSHSILHPIDIRRDYIDFFIRQGQREKFLG